MPPQVTGTVQEPGVYPYSMVSRDILNERMQGYDNGDVIDYAAGRQVSEPPWRPAIYQASWNGMNDWRTWADFDFPLQYRLALTRGSIADTMQIINLNNPAYPMDYAPQAIQDYMLNTQMVYSGGGEI